jgi:hypothetical protein
MGIITTLVFDEVFIAVHDPVVVFDDTSEKSSRVSAVNAAMLHVNLLSSCPVVVVIKRNREK